MYPELCKIEGFFARAMQQILDRQLLDQKLWANCIGVFSSGIDDADRGWRCEYWGKMMRGACLSYTLTRSPELYAVLTDAVRGLLARQEESGRISSYSVENEFYGWDLWARKYVMTGLQHYFDICRDAQLRTQILQALTAHADYILRHIGPGKIHILDTGLYWGSVNSASILEPFVRLYADTQNKRYLDFAEYILQSGGCSDGNLIDCVFDDKAPFEFPEQKAYETMSFFEGLLAYYEITGNEKAFRAVRMFVDALLQTDYTAIGSCGCTHELFDHSTVRQVIPSVEIMQETCVTVTLLRLLARLFRITGEKRLFDAIRLSANNALAGALNRNGFAQYSFERKEYLPGMLFDSYSPLRGGIRGRGIGGFKQFADGTHFGCCACIASAGFALYPLLCVTAQGNTIRVHDVLCGTYAFPAENGQIRMQISADRIRIQAPAHIRCTVRVTSGDLYTKITASCPAAVVPDADGYYTFPDMTDGREIALSVQPQWIEEQIDSAVCLHYGRWTLASDTAKAPQFVPGQPVRFIRDENGRIMHRALTPQDGEQVRFAVQTDRGDLIVTDYAAAGQDGRSAVSVWF